MRVGSLHATVRFAAAAAALGAWAGDARADAPPPDSATRPPLGKLVFHPDGPAPGAVAFAAGVLWDYPPQRVVEGQISAFPMAELNLRVGLPLAFAALARVQTALVTNEVLAGATWAHVFDDVPGAPSMALRLLGGAGFGGLVGFGLRRVLVLVPPPAGPRRRLEVALPRGRLHAA